MVATPLSALLLFSLAAAPSAPTTLAVAYFDSQGVPAELQPLGKGLADMLITDLSGLPSLTLVERQRLNQVLDELSLSRSRFIDPKTAQRLGRGLAARYILTGALHASGDVLRVDARLVAVETAAVLAAQKVEGKKDEFFAIEKELVELLVRSLDLKLGLGDKARLRRNQTESFQAWTRYSQGLEAEDRGDAATAQKRFQEALQADPDYRAARTASERLGALYAKVDAEQARGWRGRFAALDPKAPDFAAQVEALLVDADTTQEEGMKQKLAILEYLAERDLYPQTIPQLNRVALDAVALAGRFTSCPAQWEVVLKTCDYFAQRIPKDPTVLGVCRMHLKVIEGFRKEPALARSMADDWDKNRDADAKADNWMGVLARHEADIVRLLQRYAQRQP